MFSRIIPCVILTAVVLSSTSDSADLDEIIERYERLNQEVFGSSFEVDYVRDQTKNVTPSLYSGGYARSRYKIRRVNGNWHVHMVDVESSVDDNSASSKDLGTHELYQDGYYLSYRVDDGVATVARAGTMVYNLFHAFDYFHHCGIDPFRALAADVGADYAQLKEKEHLKDYTSLPQHPAFLRENSSEYVVVPGVHEIGGESCVLLEWSGMDKMWLDPNLGYALRRRVYHWVEDGPRKLDIQNEDFEEISPGLYLPRRQIVRKYANMPSERQAIWDKVTAELGYTAAKITLGEELPNEPFELPAGALVIDMVREETYRVPEEGEKPFERPILEALDIKVETASRWTWLVTACLVIVCSFIGYRFIKRRTV